MGGSITPKVSVVMPTFNQVGMLRDQLCALEEQRFKDFELIVVNDGSTDGTRYVLDRYAGPLVRRMKVVHQENAGPGEAINEGIRFACGDWWTWVSSDNVQDPDWLSVLLAAADFDPSIGAVFSAYLRRDEAGRSVLSEDCGHYRLGDQVRTPYCFFGPSFLIRPDVWLAAGGHRGKTSHDYDHWLRVEEACMDMGLSIRWVNKSLCTYRVHDNRISVTRRHEFDAPHWQQEALKRRSAS